VTRSALRRISIKLLRSARMDDSSLASMKRSRSRALSPSPKGASTVPLNQQWLAAGQHLAVVIELGRGHVKLDCAKLVFKFEEGVLACAVLDDPLLVLSHHAAQDHLSARAPFSAICGNGIGESFQFATEAVQWWPLI